MASVKLRVLAAADDIADRDRRPVHRPLAGHHRLATTRDRTPPRGAGRGPRPTLGRVGDAFAAGDQPGPGPGDRRRLGRPPDDLGDDLRAKAETLIVERGSRPWDPELRSAGPGCWSTWPPTSPRSRLPAAPRRGTPRQCGHPALHPSPRRRVRRPPRPDPRPRRRPPRAPTSTPTPHPAATTSSKQTRSRRRTGRSPPPPRDDVAQLPLARQRGRGVRRAAGEHPHHHPAPPRRHRDQRDGGPRLPHAAQRDAARRPPRPATGHRRPGQTLACQAGIIPVVLGADSEILDVGRTRDWSPTRSARPSTSATAAAPRPAAPCPQRSAKPTTSSPGPEAAKPASSDCKLLVLLPPPPRPRPRLGTPHHANGSISFHRRTSAATPDDAQSRGPSRGSRPRAGTALPRPGERPGRRATVHRSRSAMTLTCTRIPRARRRAGRGRCRCGGGRRDGS